MPHSNLMGAPPNVALTADEPLTEYVPGLKEGEVVTGTMIKKLEGQRAIGEIGATVELNGRKVWLSPKEAAKIYVGWEPPPNGEAEGTPPPPREVAGTDQEQKPGVDGDQSAESWKSTIDQLVWWPCQVKDDSYLCSCVHCKENLRLRRRVFSTDVAENLRLGRGFLSTDVTDMPEGLDATGQAIHLRGAWATRVGSFLALVTGVIIGSMVGQNLGIPFLWAVVAVLLLPILRPIFASLLPSREMSLWRYKCPKCGEKILVASDSKHLYLGKSKE